MRVGWIGAGRMGGRMALRAARAGHAVSVFANDISYEAELHAAGAGFAGSAVEAVREAEVVCLCVFSDDQARAIMLTASGGAGAPLAAMPAGAVLVVHTSGAARLMDELAAAAPAGVRLLDAPFSGQDEQVRAGALTILVGGERAAFEAARPVLEAYGRDIIHVGDLGAARSVKLANQFLYRANAEAANAALQALGAKGVDRALAVKAMTSCSGASWALEGLAHGPGMTERRRGFQRYLGVYRTAAGEDDLDVGVLDRMAGVAEDAADDL